MHVSHLFRAARKGVMSVVKPPYGETGGTLLEQETDKNGFFCQIIGYLRHLPVVERTKRLEIGRARLM